MNAHRYVEDILQEAVILFLHFIRDELIYINEQQCQTTHRKDPIQHL